MSNEVERTDHDDVDALERLLARYSRELHPNHYHRLALKYSLSQLYGRTSDYMIHNLTEELLQRKIEICQQLMTVFDVIEPGLTRLRGVTLYELHAPLMILTTRKFEKHAISKKELKCRLKEVVRYLREASTILSFEGETSPEGVMCLAAKDALLNLKDWEQIIGRF